MSSRWIRPGFVALVVTVGSLIPVPFRGNQTFGTFGPDKGLHFIGHGYLAVTLSDALASEGYTLTKSAIYAAVASTLLAVVTSILQRRIPGRVSERADLLAGALGAILGAVWGSHRS